MTALAVALLATMLVVNLCVYAAVARTMVRVSNLEHYLARGGTVVPAVSPPDRTEPMPELTTKSLRAVQSTGATRLLIVESDCVSCQETLRALGASVERGRTLVISAGPIRDVPNGVVVVEDAEQVAAVASLGYRLPTVLQLPLTATLVRDR